MIAEPLAAEAASGATATAEGSLAESQSFWALQDVATFWTVPLAHGASMPWLKPHERGLLVAIERSHGLSRTPLLIDSTEERLVDVYYSYQAAITLEAKKLVLDVAMKRRSHSEVMEALREQLVNCMKFGQTLYIRLADSACDFVHSFTSDDHFPLAVFDHAVVASLANYRLDNLWGSDHPLAKCLRSEDLSQGIFQPRFSHKASEGDDDRREGFDVVVSTHMKPNEVGEMLADSLPLALLQPICPQPSSVRLKYSHYNQEFPLDVGGTLPTTLIDERYSFSFVFHGAFRVSLLEVPAASQAAAGRGGGFGRDRFRVRAQESSSTDANSGQSDAAARRIAPDRRGVFCGLRGGVTYQVEVEEDEQAEAEARAADAATGGGAQRRVTASELAAVQQQQQRTTAAPLAGRNDSGRSRAGELLAAEMRGLSVNEIAERSERFRSLQAAQDMQDVVFGGGTDD